MRSHYAPLYTATDHAHRTTDITIIVHYAIMAGHGITLLQQHKPMY